MTDRTMTVTFDHLSDAEATMAVLESSIPGIDVELQPDAVPDRARRWGGRTKLSMRDPGS